MEQIEIYGQPAQIKRAKQAKKISIARDDYDTIHQWIISSLTRERQIYLSKLIQMGESELKVPTGNLAWLIVLVKNNMTYNNELEVLIDDTRTQLVKLKSS